MWCQFACERVTHVVWKGHQRVLMAYGDRFDGVCGACMCGWASEKVCVRE